MRRAILSILAVMAVGAVPLSSALAQPRAVMNGIGLLDYSRKPDFKVGDWAKYEMKGSSELGRTDDYVLTVVIAGEEDFWGDPCFWVETWVDWKDAPPQTQAALMSYEIFGDSTATQRLMLYMRKAISMLDENGQPRIDINKPASGMLKTRREVKNPARWTRDTLGVDTVHTPKGILRALKVVLKEGTGVTQAVGDSSVYTELRENRTSWYTTDVPITHLAREDMETIASRKTWLTGRSGDAKELNVRDRGTGTARLIDYGHGATARMLPERYRRTIKEQLAAERAAAKSAPAARR